MRPGGFPEFPEVRAPRNAAPRSFLPSASRRLSLLPWKFSYQFRVLALSAPDKLTSAVFLHLDRPVSQGCNLLGNHSSLMGQEVPDFPFAAFSLTVKVGVGKLRAPSIYDEKSARNLKERNFLSSVSKSTFLQRVYTALR